MTTRPTADVEEVTQHVKPYSRPSDLKITDMRIATIVGTRWRE